MARVITYIDGFNTYYGLKSKGWERYLWLDVQALSRNLLKADQTLCLHQVLHRPCERVSGQSQASEHLHRRNPNPAGCRHLFRPLSGDPAQMPELRVHLRRVSGE